jgi:prepilin peptidase dependent protein B
MLKHLPYRKTLGFTFTELMVALAINAILFAALTTIFLSNLDHYHRLINLYRLDQDLQVAMNLMSRDIRRAGYWANADNDVNATLNNNPFMTNSTDLTTGLSGACILFTYDYDGSGTVASISSSVDDEHYGYRLNGTNLQGRPPGAAYDCAAASTAWEDITDPGLIEITALSFTINTSTVTVGPGTKGIAIRSVDINMTGRLKNDHSVTKTLTNTVKVRNDKFIS